MLSFWERQALLEYDAIIIGGGIVGLSAASALKEKYPSMEVLLLERGLLPAGASTKNAGFACFGSPTELLSDLQTLSEEEVVSLVAQRWDGLKALEARLGRDGIGLKNHGGYEVISPSEEYCLDRLEYLNQLLHPIFQSEVYRQCDELLPEFGFGKGITHLVKNHFEAQIDTGKMMKSLMGYANHLGVTLLTGCEVEELEDQGGKVSVKAKGIDGWAFSAGQVGVCTNAFTPKLLGNRLPKELNPGRGLVLATAPIEGLPFQGVFHLDEGFFYFRNHGNRVLFGGGRNLDFEGEETTDFGTNPRIYRVLEEKLRTVILPNFADIEITDVWSGVMGFGQDKQPIEESLSPRLHLAVRLGGMGVAIGSRLGEGLADRMSG